MSDSPRDRLNVLVVAPHPDDEALGLGGTIRKLADAGHDVTVAVVTRGWSPLFPDGQVAKVREEAGRCAQTLGVGSLRFLDLPVAKLNTMASHEINASAADLIDDVRPNWVFLPFPGDRHADHRCVFDAFQVALRPTARRSYVSRVLCYETPSETHWSAPFVEPFFQPQCFVDISDQLETKLDALRCYESQIHDGPAARSIEAVRALAVWRGSTVGVRAAEAFVVIRQRLL